MQTGIRIKIACLLALAFLPFQAYALGVGKLTIQSALDEPLQATIELTSASELELSTLEVGLGSRGAFEYAGIYRAEYLLGIQFELVEESGKAFVRLSTPYPIREPFLHFIFEARWAGGQVVREYTALLDPPTYVGGPTSRIETPVMEPVRTVDRRSRVEPITPAATPETTAARPREAPVAPTVLAEPSPAPRPAPAPAPQTTETRLGPPSAIAGMPAAGETYGPVERGDVLWAIAERFQSGSDFSVPQVMMAIFQENPGAFLNNNINFLKQGQTLRIPDASTIGRLSPAQARAEVRLQMDEWQNYKARLAATPAPAVSEAPAAPDEQAAGGEAAAVPAEEAAAEESAAEADATVTDSETAAATAEKPAEGDADVLKIVRAREDTESMATGAEGQATDPGAEKQIAAYREQVELLEESLASAELEKRELGERVALLEEQIDKANRLIDMQNQELARLQQQVSKPAATAPVTSLEEPAKPVDSTPTAGAETAAVAESGPEVKQAAAPAKPAAKPAPKPAAKKPRMQPTPEPEAESFMDAALGAIRSSSFNMIGLAVLAVLVIVGIFVVIRRRRSIAEFEDSIISGTAVLDMSTAESTEPPDKTVSESSFLSDFVPGMGNMQADEVDPLAEAEVYMAYGRDEQAEEVLKEAVKKDPQRHQLKLKLLEIYRNRKDTSAFETLAEELYPADGQVPKEIWLRVAEMGKELNPANPLFQGGVPGVATTESLFGTSKRKKEGTMESLLDSGDEGDTEELDRDTEDLADTGEMPASETTMETPELDEEITEELPEIDMARGGALDVASEESAEAAAKSDFPEPDEDVLDLDMGEYEPDEARETGSFKLDDLDLDLSDTDQIDAGETTVETGRDEGGFDFDMEGIDLDLGVGAGEQATDDSEASAGSSGLEDLEGLARPADAVDIGELESGAEVDESSAADDSGELHDETLEFADVDDLSLSPEFAESATEAGSETATTDEAWDEVSTKLDLARAYIEMDDKDSAASILREVVNEGNEGQKATAGELLAELESS